MKNLNQKSLIDAVHIKTKNSREDIRITLKALLEVITESVKNGDKVSITGFGVFAPFTRKERIGVNPATKERMTIPAKKVFKFHPSKLIEIE